MLYKQRFWVKFSFSEKATKIWAICLMVLTFTAFLRRPQKIVQSALWFWRLLSKCQNHEEDFANFCGLLRKAELYVPVATWFSKKKFQGKKRPQKSMTIGSPEILTKRKKEKKQRTSAGHHFLNHPKNEFSTGFVTFHDTY